MKVTRLVPRIRFIDYDPRIVGPVSSTPAGG